MLTGVEDLVDQVEGVVAGVVGWIRTDAFVLLLVQRKDCAMTRVGSML
jgi:hypothetical protein